MSRRLGLKIFATLQLPPKDRFDRPSNVSGAFQFASVVSMRCLGIDFSGNFRMWSPGCGTSNVWIAETEGSDRRLKLVNLRRVQQLDGDCAPFTRLAQYLRETDFDVAAIDAPFSIPLEHLHSRPHRDLLELVANMELSGGRPFPSAREFVDRVFEGLSPATRKPLRRTEEYWTPLDLNVRSTLWAGPRGGAAMTVACLKLLHEANCPIWPWERSGRRLLVEVFPAAQLRHWSLPHQAYNRNTEKELAVRRSLVLALSERIDLGEFTEKLQQSADALDAVVCAFAANAVGAGHTLSYAEDAARAEGLIAVASV
jgi:predicted nuclease with RNAse H fold